MLPKDPTPHPIEYNKENDGIAMNINTTLGNNVQITSIKRTMRYLVTF
ncbi:MAG TPA: hypothetical protein VEY70_15325 [Metabacillus sp.]|nr:hypothetical protein [Metabacillus sp.]